MKILSKKPFYADGLLAVICILTAFIEPPISSRNFWTIFSFILLLSLIIFFVLPHARVVELNREGCTVCWFGTKRNFKWKELEVISYGDIGVVRGERWEGIFFSRDAVKNGKKMTPMRIYNSLDIFNTFYILFLTKTQKKQIMQQLSDWKIKIAFDDEFMQKREYKRVLEEKIQMREERKRLYEDRKKRKR